MKTAAIAALLPAIAVGCASTPDPAIRDQAMAAYRDCLRTAARQLDDGTSELMTIALAVKARCGQEYLAYTKTYTANLHPVYAAEFMAEAERTRLESAATAVATHRTRARAGR